MASNRRYNPKNTKAPIPFDADEADSAMERFIRQKYQEKAIGAPARNNTGSTNSDDQPPPLPPKTGSRFGFRSASSIFPLSSKSRQRDAARHDFEDARAQTPPSPRKNKQSRVFGTSVGAGGSDDLTMKMEKLRDMGFTDETRNLAILKGLSGNLEKSIETLVRLGEGGNSAGGVKSSGNATPTSRSRTPLSAGAGISFNRTTREVPSPQVSSNPFDMLDAPPAVAQPQSSQSTGSAQMNNPYQQQQQPPNSNPFGLAPSQSQYNLNHAFQNMAVTTSQPLFPHHTGGFPTPQQTPQQQLYQQSMTPPVPSLPQQYHPPAIYENPTQQPQQPQQSTSYNPFMQKSQQSQPAPINTNFLSNPYNQQLATPQSLYHSPAEQSPRQHYPPTIYENGGQQQPQQSQQQMNPFLAQNGFQQPLATYSNQTNHQQHQQMSNPYSSPVQQQPWNPYSSTVQQQQSNPYSSPITAPQQQVPLPQQVPLQQQSNPYAGQFNAQQQAPQHVQPGFDQSQQYRQQTYPLVSQATGRADKRSILDLYNYPQLAPTPQRQQQQPHDPNQSQQQQASTNTGISAYQAPMVSSPLAQGPGSKNPFALTGGSNIQNPATDTLGNLVSFAPVQNGPRHVSQESIQINDAGAWNNGRHSPDAWGSISARSMR